MQYEGCALTEIILDSRRWFLDPHLHLVLYAALLICPLEQTQGTAGARERLGHSTGGDGGDQVEHQQRQPLLQQGGLRARHGLGVSGQGSLNTRLIDIHPGARLAQILVTHADVSIQTAGQIGQLRARLTNLGATST